MNCLLIAATPFEIAPFLEGYRASTDSVPAGVILDVVISGIGLTACTYHLQKQITLKRPDIVIQAGIAGCFDQSIPLLESFLISQDRIADEGVMEASELRSLFDLGLAAPDNAPFIGGWLKNPHEKLLMSSKLKKVPGISINQITVSPSMINAYSAKFGPVTESMEGAALHYVCLQENVPFLQLRTVSNYIGERNKQKWKIKESIAALNYELNSLLPSLIP